MMAMREIRCQCFLDNPGSRSDLSAFVWKNRPSLTDTNKHPREQESRRMCKTLLEFRLISENNGRKYMFMGPIANNAHLDLASTVVGHVFR